MKLIKKVIQYLIEFFSRNQEEIEKLLLAVIQMIVFDILSGEDKAVKKEI